MIVSSLLISTRKACGNRVAGLGAGTTGSAQAKLGHDQVFAANLYREALQLYRAQNWDIAELQFINLQKQYPGRYLYQMYVERINYFRQYPPGYCWDGVFTYETK